MFALTYKRLIALIVPAFAMTGLAACSQSGSASDTSTTPTSRTTTIASSSAGTPGDARTLVVYFSVPETDDPENMTEAEEDSTHVVDGEVLGNTQYVARLIAAQTEANVFRVETAERLPLDHDVLVQQAKSEQERDARPKLKAPVANLDDYDTVFVGYPIWWADLPMVMYTFFEQHDFTGKSVVPFSTHGGSQLAGTVDTIVELLPGATVVTDAFTISRDDMDDAEAEVGTWLDGLDYPRRRQ